MVVVGGGGVGGGREFSECVADVSRKGSAPWRGELNSHGLPGTALAGKKGMLHG